MRQRILKFVGVAAVISIGLLASVAGQSPTTTQKTAPALKTSWGEPDLQGIWTRDYDMPMQRPAKYKDQEFFTEAQLAELDQIRAARPGNETRSVRGTE